MKYLPLTAAALALLAAGFLSAQTQSVYSGASATGQLILTRTVNLSQTAQAHAASLASAALSRTPAESIQATLVQRDPGKVIPLLRPGISAVPVSHAPIAQAPAAIRRQLPRIEQSLSVAPQTQSTGFDGITHMQQRLANHGNQFSVEPPSPAIAVGNGFVLEGVNNAVQVYNTAGAPLLPAVLSSNQVFGLAPAIDQTTGIQGVFPTDMRVYFDSTSSRWYILQRAQDSDAAGNELPFSHLYLAVSQTSDPTGTYNIYVMDTTDNLNFFGCPCFSDYPQIGTDQYGLYISANEYNAYYPYFVDATILAINKTALASGVTAPTAVLFTLAAVTGYEFAIQPAGTPPGGSNFVASGGVEFFVSSQSRFAIDNSLAVWAMTNTSTLLTSSPSLQLLRINIPTQTYSIPDVANQKPGTLTYGASLIPPGTLAVLDGSDDRVLSVAYAGGRLFVTLASAVLDSQNRQRVGGAYFILSPALRSGLLSAPVLRQGYLQVDGNHLLRPAVAVNPQGSGAIVFTLVGSDYFPSAAFLPISVTSTSSTIQLAAAGFAPEDGFSGYQDPGQQGIARWGDYSGAVVAADGSIWMIAEYIPNADRSPKANWGTYVIRYKP